MAEPKYTISIGDRTRLSFAGVLDIGYRYRKRVKNDDTTVINTFFGGFGGDIFLDVDITDSFGMGGGLVS